MDTFDTPNAEALAVALLLGRVVMGALFAAHGTQKLFGWFRGPGLEATAGFLESLGFYPGRAFAWAAGATELAAGVLIALGFLGPLGPALLLGVMTVAIVTVHWGSGLLATSNGSELPILYSTGAVVVASTGTGPYSLDALLGLSGLSSPRVAGTVLALGVIAGLANTLSRRRPVAQHT